MSDLARAIVIAAVLLGSAVVVRGMFGSERFELTPAVNGTAYRLDRVTGAVHFCTPAICRPVPRLVPNAGGPPKEVQPAPQRAAPPAEASGQSTT